MFRKPWQELAENKNFREGNHFEDASIKVEESKRAEVERQMEIPSFLLNLEKRDLPTEISIEVQVVDANREDKDGVVETFVVIGGMGEDVAVMKPFIKALAMEGKQVVAISMPGYGNSGDPDKSWRYHMEEDGKKSAVKKTYEDYANVIKDVLEKLQIDSESLGIRKPSEKTTLVGHSLGGLMVSEYAKRNPASVEKMFLVSPGGIDKESLFVDGNIVPPRLTADFIFRHFQERLPTIFKLFSDMPPVIKNMWLTNFANRNTSTDPKNPFFERRLFQRFWEGSVSTHQGLEANIAEALQLGIPVEIFAGEKDGFFKVEKYRKLVDRLQEVSGEKNGKLDLLEIPKAGHYGILDKADVFASLVVEK
ncbi:MAG: alpha/beta hydrolase [Candidatus Magasanikbacteria bacterium]